MTLGLASLSILILVGKFFPDMIPSKSLPFYNRTTTLTPPNITYDVDHCPFIPYKDLSKLQVTQNSRSKSSLKESWLEEFVQ